MNAAYLPGGNTGRIPFGPLVRTPTAANFYLSTKRTPE